MDEKEEFNLTLPIILIGILAIAVLLFFTLFDENGFGFNSNSVNDSIGEQAAAAYHFVAPDRVTEGGNAMFSWKADVSKGATCEGKSEPDGSDGGWSGEKNIAGTQKVGPIEKNTTYFLDCIDGEEVTRDIELVAIVKPKISLSSSATAVTSNETATLSWDAVSVHGCELSDGESVISTVNAGTLEVESLETSTTFTLTCKTDGEPLVESITINVN